MRIKELLKEKGCTQQELADMVGVSYQSIKQTLNASSVTALNVPMWQLFASSEEVAQQTKNDLCPYCGQPITIKTTIEKV